MKKWMAFLACFLILGGVFSACNKSNADTVASGEVIYENDPVLGAWQEDTYINEALGIRFTLPENWEYLSANEVATLVTQENPAVRYALYAQQPDTNSTILAAVTDLEEAGFDPATPVADLVAQDLESIDSAKETTVSEVYPYTLGDVEYLACDMHNNTMSGMSLYRVVDGRLVLIQLISNDESDLIEDMLSHFS